MKLKDMIKLVYPPVWLIALLVPVCAAALVYTFVCGYEEHPVAYLIYVLSFYTLTCIVIRCTKIIPKHYRTAKNAVYGNPVGNRFMTDMKFRTHVTLYGSLGFNFLYAAVLLLGGEHQNGSLGAGLHGVDTGNGIGGTVSLDLDVHLDRMLVEHTYTYDGSADAYERADQRYRDEFELRPHFIHHPSSCPGSR